MTKRSAKERNLTQEQINQRFPRFAHITISDLALQRLYSLYISRTHNPPPQTIEELMDYFSTLEYKDSRPAHLLPLVFHNVILDSLKDDTTTTVETFCSATVYYNLCVRAREIMYPLTHRASRTYRSSLSVSATVSHFLEAIGLSLIEIDDTPPQIYNPLINHVNQQLDTTIEYNIPEYQKYYITDKAYWSLCKMAEKYQYIRKPHFKNKEKDDLYKYADPARLSSIAEPDDPRRSFNPYAGNASGLSLFLERLSFLKFEDTRPNDILEEQKDYPIPIWSILDLYNPAKPRQWHLSLNAILNYVTLAQEFDIQRTTIQSIEVVDKNGVPYQKNFQQYKHKLTPLAVAGAVIEAIGLKYLSPVKMTLPNRTFATQQRYNNDTEFYF